VAIKVYEELADAFQQSKGVIIAKVDADAHKALGGRFDVKGFPTLKWFVTCLITTKMSLLTLCIQGSRRAPRLPKITTVVVTLILLSNLFRMGQVPIIALFLWFYFYALCNFCFD
jgi:hypothetical protein